MTTTFEFQMDEAFPAEDEIARYIVRMSMALGDLRISTKLAVREEQPDEERLYFVRLASGHLFELAMLFEKNPSWGPGLETVIEALAASDQEAISIRKAHQKVRRAFKAEVPLIGRPLRAELERTRDSFFHYHRHAKSDKALKNAMTRVAALSSQLVASSESIRAEYADLVSERLTHPWPLDEPRNSEVGRSLHLAIIELQADVAAYVQLVEARYLRVTRGDVVTITRED